MNGLEVLRILRKCHRLMRMRSLLIFFFFQAEDGIRDIGVTGVQTCALPISRELVVRPVLQQVLADAVRDDASGRVPAGLEHLPVHGANERCGERRALDQDDVASLDTRRVGDEDVRQALDAGVGHARGAATSRAGSLTNEPAFQISSPSAYTSPSSRRSQIMSQWRPDEFLAPVSWKPAPSARCIVPPIFSSR